MFQGLSGGAIFRPSRFVDPPGGDEGSWSGLVTTTGRGRRTEVPELIWLPSLPSTGTVIGGRLRPTSEDARSGSLGDESEEGGGET